MGEVETCIHCDCVITLIGSLWKDPLYGDTCPARRGKHRYWNHEPMPIPSPAEKDRSRKIAENIRGENQTIRGFHHTGESWYAYTALENAEYKDEIMFGLYCEDGGCKGEMSVRWIELSSTVTPRLQAFDDSWKVLASFADVLEAMAEVDGKDITPKAFCELLLRNGFKDLTKRIREDAV